MRKFLSIVFLSILIIFTISILVLANDTEMSRLRLSVINANENYDLYILLPKKYIMYAINHDGLDINYDGANTLKYNVIPSIIVDINNVANDTYIEDGVEYIQIKLNDLGEDEYLFEIIPEYTDMDMRYRIKSESIDNIMIIDNFKIEDNLCEMKYDFNTNEIKTEKDSNIEIRFNIYWWQILIIAILIVFIMYLSKRRTN